MDDQQATEQVRNPSQVLEGYIQHQKEESKNHSDMKIPNYRLS